MLITAIPNNGLF